MPLPPPTASAVLICSYERRFQTPQDYSQGGYVDDFQMYGFTAVVYSNYAYELETGGQRTNHSGRVTEVFVLRKGQWVNPGWHMDSGK